MWLRRAFFTWLFPAAFVLPLWLVVGWGVFQAGAWAFLWVLFIAVPSVFVGQLVLTLLVRSRPTVRAERAVSWWDVLGFALWHGLTIAVGFYNPAFFVAALVFAIIVGLALFWLSIWQLLSESRGALQRVVVTTQSAADPLYQERVRERARENSEYIVITETGRPGDGREFH